MSGPFGLAVHVAAALALTLVALAGSPLGAFAAAPLVLALLLQGAACARGVQPATPHRSVALGVLLLGFAVATLWTGSGAACLLLLAAGVAVIRWATGAALAADPLPTRSSVEAPQGLAIHVGVAADEGLRALLELSRLARPGPDYTRLAAEARIAADRNQELGWLARPERAHPLPPPLEKPHIASCQVAGVGPAEHLCFSSEFEPQDPEVRSDYLAADRNRTAHAYLFRDARSPRPTLMFVHGYGTGRPALDARVARVPWLRKLGLDVALFVLPLHGPRALGRRSGAGFLDGHPLWTNAALGQAVWDLRRLAGFLRTEGAPALGVCGLSVGGYAAALLASLHDGLACAVVMTAPAALDELFWRELPRSRSDAARAVGLTPHILQNAWARHAPLRVRPRVPHEGRLVVGGTADRIVAPAQVEALWEHWGQPRLHWFPGSHLLWRGGDDLRASIGGHLRETLVQAG